MHKADEALAAAKREHDAGDLGLVINRVYYACFYAVTAVLLAEGKKFSRHAGVKSALHQHFVKTGRIPAELGEFYDTAFDDRNEVDYQIIPQPQSAVVQEQIAKAEQFVAEMKRLLGK